MFPLRVILRKSCSLKGVAQLSSYQRQFKEISIPVPWGHVAGKWWEPYDVRPILSLHGWQDNCGTFDRLLPMLDKNVGFLAIDHPGHGLSSRLPFGIYYHFSSYLITINFIRTFMNWDSVSFLGHSLGGILSYTYSMLYPERVDFAICLDGAKPMVRTNSIKRMADALDKFHKYSAFADSLEEPPSYTIDEIKEKLAKPNKNSVELQYTHFLMERNIAPSKKHPGKYYFTRDPRLKLGELLSFSQDELIEHAQYMTSPICIIKAKGSSYYEIKENFYTVLDVLKRTSRDCDFQYVEGTHHVHLNYPERVAGIVNSFIERHNVADRASGGMVEKMVVQN
ncbi:unnamed protein product [Acanthoscelides obtectus]|uniref:AB hydrolase-1 domain-containing protein n=1 Tax=Acanthoscelides obtectus TaxID=200917 RepID=A0A9P0M282_ACAOB|nr:unnamed protein product [Acanthoscelides obtectus]CAK1664880.1 Probable serine hydrolase [Acanthoscelides obtectus]